MDAHGKHLYRWPSRLGVGDDDRTVGSGATPGTYELSVLGTGTSGTQTSTFALTIPGQGYKSHQGHQAQGN